MGLPPGGEGVSELGCLVHDSSSDSDHDVVDWVDHANETAGIVR